MSFIITDFSGSSTLPPDLCSKWGVPGSKHNY